MWGRQNEQMWRSIPNPFSNMKYENNVITGHVSGRKADIIELVMGGQSAVILVGSPSIGKSTLIRYLQRPASAAWSWRNELGGEEDSPFLKNIHFVQVDLTGLVGIENPNQLCNEFIAECSSKIHEVYVRNHQGTHDIKSLRELLRDNYRQQLRGRCFVMLDNIVELLPADKRLVSADDEKMPQERAIAILDHAGIIRVLVDLIDEFRNFGVIITFESQPRPSIDDQFNHVSADLARFTTTTLQTFTLKDTKAFLQQQPESFGKEWAKDFKESGAQTIFSEEERGWLLKQAGTHPYILQQFCIETFQMKRDYIYEATYELQEQYKRQLIEHINAGLSIFLTNVWSRLQDALNKSSWEAKENFSLFIKLLKEDVSPEQAIDPVAWDNLGPELHYILRNEGIVRSEPGLPVYYPGDTLRNSLIAKAARSSVASTSPATASAGRNLWLTVNMPERPTQRLLLSDIEYRLFKTLLHEPARYHEEDLLKSGWDTPVSRTTLTQRIHHLRKKLKEICGDEEIIQNHYGGFYSLNHSEWFALGN